MSFKGYVKARQVLAAGVGAVGVSLALVGLVESCYHAPAGLAAKMYGFGLYGLFGMGLGLLLALLFGGKARLSREGLLRFAGRVAVVPVSVLALAAGAFFVYRDLWRESVAQAGLGGFAAMVLVLLGAGLLAFISRSIGRVIAPRARWIGAVFLILSVLGLVLGRVTDTVFRSYPVPTHPVDERPGMIFVVVDALRADAVSPDTTPNLHAFSRDAMVFRKAWSAATWTRPAVASIFTGRHPSVHAAVHKADRLPEDLPTLASLLGQSGYATLASITNVNLDPVFGLGRGFDWYGYLAPQPFLYAPDSARGLFLLELYRLVRLRFFPGSREVSHYYADGERVLSQAKLLIQPFSDGSQPFFAYLHFMEPHDPYFAHPYDGHAVARVENPNPPVERAPELLDLYRQEVRYWDGLLGKLLAFLKEKQLYDRCLIVVTSDHGEEFSDHGGFWHGTTLYQEQIQVPLAVRFPEGAGAGTVRQEPVSLVDLMPTALALAGIEPDSSLPGVALSPQPVPADRVNRVLFAEEDHQGCVLKAVLSGSWKLITANSGNPRGLPVIQLFDLDADPLEKNDLSRREPQQRDKLLGILKAGPNQPARPSGPRQTLLLDAEVEEQLHSLGYTD